MLGNFEEAIYGQTLTFPNATIKITSTSNKDAVSFGAIDTLVLNDGDFDALLQAGDILATDEAGPL